MGTKATQFIQCFFRKCVPNGNQLANILIILVIAEIQSSCHSVTDSYALCCLFRMHLFMSPSLQLIISYEPKINYVQRNCT